MRRLRAVLLGLACLAALPVRAEDRVWEIDGVRLEPAQVERLARQMAEQTLDAVDRNVADIELDDAQRRHMLEIYRSVSLDVYGEIVDVVNRDDLDDRTKEDRMRELALDGQRRSHDQLREVLSPAQMEAYAAWEAKQVAAFNSKRWERRRRRARR